jgi:hypothetical protein
MRYRGSAYSALLFCAALAAAPTFAATKQQPPPAKAPPAGRSAPVTNIRPNFSPAIGRPGINAFARPRINPGIATPAFAPALQNRGASAPLRAAALDPARPRLAPRVARPGDLHGRDFHALRPAELARWRNGLWRNEWHGGRVGWWWVSDDAWYFYPAPVYPYPDFIPDVDPADAGADAAAEMAPPPGVAPQMTIVGGLPPPTFWYFCDNPRGYYPYVGTCNAQWRPVPTAPPPGGTP